LDPGTRSLRVRARAANPGGDLLPGAYAELTVTLDEIPDGLLVPALSVTQDIKGLKAYVIRSGKVEARYVRTGIQQGDFVQITEGLQAGDTVITTSLLSLREAMPVKARTVADLSKP
jgi:membrane fusion protein (multidrug efflux system)